MSYLLYTYIRSLNKKLRTPVTFHTRLKYSDDRYLKMCGFCCLRYPQVSDNCIDMEDVESVAFYICILKPD